METLTKTHDNTLTEREWRAFELKYQGEDYGTISKETGYTHETVKFYFSRNGRWYELYQEYVGEQNTLRKSEAMELFRKNLAMAVEVLVKEMQEGDSSQARIKAAQEIIDRELGSSRKQLEVQVGPRNPYERWTLEQIQTKIRESGDRRKTFTQVEK